LPQEKYPKVSALEAKSSHRRHDSTNFPDKILFPVILNLKVIVGDCDHVNPMRLIESRINFKKSFRPRLLILIYADHPTMIVTGTEAWLGAGMKATEQVILPRSIIL
jgi:hypothetical protein